jgi:hypothetical protein
MRWFSTARSSHQLLRSGDKSLSVRCTRVLRAGDHQDHPPEARRRVADATNLTDAERAKLEARRDRLMKLMKEDDLEADDRADLTQEWNKIDQLLNRR